MVAHALTFFLDGVETSSIVLQYALYELAANPTVQEQLREKIDEMLKKNDSHLTYDAIQSVPLLEMVIFGKISLVTVSILLMISLALQRP